MNRIGKQFYFKSRKIPGIRLSGVRITVARQLVSYTRFTLYECKYKM